MSTTDVASFDTGASLADWQAGTITGIVAGVVMGALIAATNPPTLGAAIPALYGLSGGAAGVVVHLSHGAVLGVAFAALVRLLAPDSSGTILALGLGWGVATWVGLAAIVMPVWLSVVGFPAAPPLPNFALPSLAWHLVYGVVAAVVYPVLR